MAGLLKRLFSRKSRQPSWEPLLTANVESLFENWSRGFDIDPQPQVNTTINDFVGNWAVTGRNTGSKGASYFGTLTLSAMGGMVKAYWEIGHTRQPQYGVGFIHNNLLALDFFYTDNAERCYGQVIYRLANNRLVGLWREYNNREIAMEEAILKNRLV